MFQMTGPLHRKCEVCRVRIVVEERSTSGHLMRSRSRYFHSDEGVCFKMGTLWARWFCNSCVSEMRMSDFAEDVRGRVMRV